jgi:putative ABC transport system ATP-binding protein
MVTHDPRAAAYAHRVLFLADGLLVPELTSPTQASVLNVLGLLGADPTDTDPAAPATPPAVEPVSVGVL